MTILKTAARETTFEPVFKKKKKRFQGFFLRGGLTSNIAIQPVLQKFCKKVARFFGLFEPYLWLKFRPHAAIEPANG